MAIKGNINSIENKMATVVRDVFYTKQEIVAQSDVKKIGETVEMLVVEVDQQKYEEYLSQGRSIRLECGVIFV